MKDSVIYLMKNSANIQLARSELKSDPSGNHDVLQARQILLQLQELLEVLHLHHDALKLQHHLRDVRQRRWKDAEPGLQREEPP